MQPSSSESEWRKRQATPITIPLSLAWRVFDFFSAKGQDEDAAFIKGNYIFDSR